MVNLAYGGGGSGNNISYILEHPQDMMVDYVRVWQGTGGSVNAADISDAPATSFWNWPPQLLMHINDSIDISGVSLVYMPDGRLNVINNQNLVLYRTDIPPHPCDSQCQVAFQNDGNFVFSDSKGPYWSAGTWGRNAAILTFSNVEPYLEITDEMCNSVWSTTNKTSSFQHSVRSE